MILPVVAVWPSVRASLRSKNSQLSCTSIDSDEYNLETAHHLPASSKTRDTIVYKCIYGTEKDANDTYRDP